VSSVLSRAPVRFAPPKPNALGRRGILRFYKFFFCQMSLVIVHVLGLSKTAGLILASLSEGGLSFASASLVTTGRWSECAAPVKVVGGEPICCHLHTEAWAWVWAPPKRKTSQGGRHYPSGHEAEHRAAWWRWRCWVWM